jgi:exosome complex RNA-binding protein Csl4
MAKSNLQRQKEFLERKRLGVILPKCLQCNITLKSQKTREQCYCAKCFLDTIEGRRENKKRLKKYRK